MQRRLEEVIIDRLRSLQRATGTQELCLAGGVAYNCVVNGKILEQTGFEDIYIQSAAVTRDWLLAQPLINGIRAACTSVNS